MAKMTREMTSKEFDALMESIGDMGDYACKGFSHNIGHTPENWDGISFESSNGSFLYAPRFHVAHPLTKGKTGIDYNALEVRFHSSYPFDKEETYTISNRDWVKKFKAATQDPLALYRQYGGKSATAGV